MTTETRTWTEAPASATVKIDLAGWDVLFTLRGETGAEVLPKVQSLIAWAKEHGGIPAGGRYRAALAEPPGPDFAPPLHAAPQADEPEAGVTRCEWATVTVDPNKGVTVAEFWCAGRKYPEHRVAGWETGRLLELLAPLDADGSPARYDTPVNVHWKRGKPRANGQGFYQDVQRITIPA